MLDLESMTYAELKSQALENIIALENPAIPPQYRVSRHTSYQEILNALAADIRSKHRRRLDRQRDIDATHQTLAELEKKAAVSTGDANASPPGELSLPFPMKFPPNFTSYYRFRGKAHHYVKTSKEVPT